eukprot:gene16624-22871_t
MNLGKFAKPVTVAKPARYSRAFQPPTRICTAPRNLATPVGKSPDPDMEQLQEQCSEAVKSSTHEEEQRKLNEREAIMASICNVVEQPNK